MWGLTLGPEPLRPRSGGVGSMGLVWCGIYPVHRYTYICVPCCALIGEGFRLDPVPRGYKPRLYLYVKRYVKTISGTSMWVVRSSITWAAVQELILR